MGLALAVGSTEASAAVVLFESADFGGAGQGYGYSLGSEQYLGVRFHNDAPWRIEDVGGHLFQSQEVPDGLFVAIVPLDGPEDLPHFATLSDAAWQTTLTAPLLSNDVFVPSGALLEPGWWGLIFGGGGLFGSQSSGGMAAYQADIGYPLYIRFQSGVWEDSGTVGKRFVIRGTIACIEDTSDTAVQCNEDCDDALDNDADGWFDCQDEDCWHLSTCCDGDLDGFRRADEVCGWGPDCNDHPDVGPAYFPGAAEVVNDGIDQNCDGVDTCWADVDHDGFGSMVRTVVGDDLDCATGSSESDLPTDCDDGKAWVFPGSAETVADGVDADCDGSELCWLDRDGDGYGALEQVVVVGLDCLLEPGAAFLAGDCRDGGDDAPEFHPGAWDEPADGIDQDCDGVDTCFVDYDRDGFGTPLTAPGLSMTCAYDPGFSDSDLDCDDLGPFSSSVRPGASEVPADGIDQDCDGLDACWLDADGDGYGGPVAVQAAAADCATAVGFAAWSDDCLDEGPGAEDVHPYAAEIPGDGVDQDCNDVDDCFYDRDLDGWGGPISTRGTGLVCDGSEGLSSDGGDCRDVGTGAAAMHPGAAELAADGIDQDCDGVDACYVDLDGDGWGIELTEPATIEPCGAAVGQASQSGDCDDDRAAVHPGAVDLVADGVDEDCLEGDACYEDLDGDGWGSAILVGTVTSCDDDPRASRVSGDCDDLDPRAMPAGEEVPYDGIDGDCRDGDMVDRDADGHAWTGVGGDDCDDADRQIAPGAVEHADGRDDDCDGVVDEGTRYFDDDGDGLTEAGGDCDDGNARRAPGRIEVCDGLDNDCDFRVDDGTECVDDDLDGQSEVQGDCNDADPLVGRGAVEVDGNGVDDDCDGMLSGEAFDPDGDGWLVAAGDCDDAVRTTHPGAPELPNGLDDDCDGFIDEGTPLGDDDGDGVTEEGGDCLDSDPRIKPGATEIVNGVDDNCDGLVDVDNETRDQDGDGYRAGAECNDLDSAIHPGAREVRNGVDDDCDLVIDNVYDEDEDGLSRADGDCDDRHGWVRPGAREDCDGLDNDCDGQTDERCGAGSGASVALGRGCAVATPWGNGALLGLSLAMFVARRRRSG